MNNANDPYVIFTKKGELSLLFRGTNEKVLLREIKMKFGNKMGFLVSLFDLPVELEENINFNQILHNLKFFEKEFEVLFSEIKVPKNNIAAQKIFDLLKNLNKENTNFLSIMNEERNSLVNSLLKNNINQQILDCITKENETFILIKKVISEKQTYKLGNFEDKDKQVFVSTRAKIYRNDDLKDLKDISPINLLAAKLILGDKSTVQYIITFEDILKTLFKDLLIFRSKEEIKLWKEEIKKYESVHANNVVYLSGMRNFLKGENMSFNNEFGKGNFSKNFGSTYKNKEEIAEIEKMRILSFTSHLEQFNGKRTNHLKLVSVNDDIISEKSIAEIKMVKKENG